MRAAASRTMLCRAPAAGHGKERVEVTSRTSDLICLFFTLTKSYCWNVTGMGSICSRRCRAKCWGKLVLRLVLTGLSPTVGSMGAEGNDNAAAWLPTSPCVPAALVPYAVSLSRSHQSCLLQFQVLPPQLINVLRADVSLTIVFCN